MADFIIKEGDGLPVLRVELKNSDGTAIDLSGATVEFKYRLKKSGSTTVTRDADVEDADNGVVQYSWVDADTVTPGVYIAEFIVTFESGKEISFPTDSYLIFEVVGDLE